MAETRAVGRKENVVGRKETVVGRKEGAAFNASADILMGKGAQVLPRLPAEGR